MFQKKAQLIVLNGTLTRFFKGTISFHNHGCFLLIHAYAVELFLAMHL